MPQDEKKRRAAEAALRYIEDDTIVGVGTGSTVNYFIEALARIKHRIEGAVASSVASEALLAEHGIPTIPLNSAGRVPLYVDSADEATRHRCLIKGGGGALTREKIIATASDRFVCILDDSKLVDILGTFPLAVEVLPFARSYVARQLAKLGGQPVLREAFTTDNGNLILDVRYSKILHPQELERELNAIPGLVCSGLFALRPADLLLLAEADGVREI